MKTIFVLLLLAANPDTRAWTCHADPAIESRYPKWQQYGDAVYADAVAQAKAKGLPDPYEVQRAKVAAADAVAMTPTNIAARPFEKPIAQAEQCENCNGTGYYQGRFCEDCGGDGVLTFNDVLRVIRKVWFAQQTKPRELPAIVERLPMTDPLVVDPPAAPLPKMQPLTAAVPLKVVWLKTLDNLAEACEASGKPSFIFWFGDQCEACEHDKLILLNNSAVLAYLAENFECTKQNAERISESRRINLGITSWPKYMVTTPDYKFYVHVERSTDPEVFLASLHTAKAWAIKGKGR